MPLVKKSFTLEGHKTSVALEQEFWEIICEYAAKNNKSLASIISETDLNRGADPLASSLRLFCLRVLKS
jgi:predicted DNA-binding ribbon-helix-helix protein